MNVIMSYVEYIRLDAVVGQSVILCCNTSLTSDIAWSYDTDDSYDVVHYVYGNFTNDRDRPWLSVNSTGGDFHSLVIADIQLKNSGLYDCYDAKGKRKVGYQLIVTGMRSVCYDVAVN